MNELARTVARLSDAIAEGEARLHEAWWEMSLTSSPRASAEKTEAEIALRDVLADRDVFAVLEAGRDQPPDDPLLARQAERLYLAALPEQVPANLRREIVELSTEIESSFNAFRATVDGKQVTDNDIDDVLRDSDDEGERRAYWEASKLVGEEVAAHVRRLAGLRNRAARELGYSDHRALALATQEFTPGWLAGMLEEIARHTDRPFAAWKIGLDASLSQRFGTDDLRPWHYGDPFFQEAPADAGIDLDAVFGKLDLEELTVRTYDDLGIPISAALAKSDLLPKPGKSQHAFCLHVDRSGDVRVLCNNRPSERWMSTMLHEFGHAAYDLYIDRSLPFVLREPAHIFTTEGVAILLGHLIHDPAWLGLYAGTAADQALEVAAGAAATRRASLLTFARWGLVMAHFEEALYADPDRADLDVLWWDLVERYQDVRRPDGRSSPDWAAKIHLAVAPVYYHNYLLGELFAAQVAEACSPLAGSPDAGGWLREKVFAPGAARRWDELCQAAFGGPLSAAAWGAAMDA